MRLKRINRFLGFAFIVICLAMSAFIYLVDEGVAFALSGTAGNSGGTPMLASYIGFAPILLVGAWAGVVLLVRQYRNWQVRREKLKRLQKTVAR